MTQNQNRTFPETVADLFIELERKGVSRKAIAAAMCTGERYVGYVVSGQRTPSYAAMRLLNQRGGIIISQSLSEDFCRGSRCRASIEIISDVENLDKNHDGRIDAGDVLALDIEALQQLAAVAQRISDRAENGKLGNADKSKLREQLAQAEMKLKMSRAALDMDDTAPMRLANH